MVHLPDFNRQALPTQRCRCARCGQPSEDGRRRCSVIILFPFWILVLTCNQYNDGCSILERHLRRTSESDERGEGQERAPSEERTKFRNTTWKNDQYRYGGLLLNLESWFKICRMMWWVSAGWLANRECTNEATRKGQSIRHTPLSQNHSHYHPQQR